MKKTFPVNINGTIFYIDEDAYTQIDNYLSQLRHAFPGDEGAEIVSDIEARISEMFSELNISGKSVIDIENVNDMIARMGRPSELGGATNEESDSYGQNEENAEDDTNAREEGASRGAATVTPPPFGGVTKKLYRDVKHKVFGGVISGIACYLGWNANVLRLLVTLVALMTHVWPLIIIYLIAWMIIPAAVTPRQILEMNGTPVTVGTVGDTIIGSSTPDSYKQGAGFMGALGNVVLIIIAVVAALIVLGDFALFVKLLSGTVGYCFLGSDNLLSDFGFYPSRHIVLSIIGAFCIIFSVALIGVAAIWGICATVLKKRGIPRKYVVSGIIVVALLILASIVLFTIASVSTAEDAFIRSSAMSSAICLVNIF